jgi:hypothetical protein
VPAERFISSVSYFDVHVCVALLYGAIL